MDYKIIWTFMGIVLLISISSVINQLRNDIARINLTLDKIAKQMGVPDTVTENIDAELINLILEGKMIEAVKKYRMVTGAGLKEAKDYVDRLNARNLNKSQQ